LNNETFTKPLSGKDREYCRHYIPIDENDVARILRDVDLGSIEELYAHIPSEFKFTSELDLPVELDRSELKAEMERIASKNRLGLSFLGDGLPDYEPHPIVSEILNIRELATAYTPYQPERSQGTLITQWIYQCCMAALTGFEAINASLYDRSTALFEASLTAIRATKGKNRVLISEGIYPGDRDVINTHFSGTEFVCDWIPLNPETGLMDRQQLVRLVDQHPGDIAAIAFPQVNSLGYVEDFHGITAFCENNGFMSIAIIDPIHLVKGGLKPPDKWAQYGADIVVGEAQHLALRDWVYLEFARMNVEGTWFGLLQGAMLEKQRMYLAEIVLSP